MMLSTPIYQLKRRAKAMAREEAIPLHSAQDRVAAAQGFASWSLLAARAAEAAATDLLRAMPEGGLALVAARPGHGKTLVALRTLVDAARAGRSATLFTLHMTETEARGHLLEVAGSGAVPDIALDTSDEIDAAHIVARLSEAPRGAVAVIDTLQLLDERRSKPPVAEQLRMLHDFAHTNGALLLFVSQVDRTFEARGGSLPDIADIRLPNPVPLELFSRAVFLHEGEERVVALN